ncbi:MAG: hypothetical protein HN826_07610 [Methylococcales bacterium]|nr:hypothetical protein [Methylococcales bacterium]
MIQSNFIDFRPSNHNDQQSEGFWPSFTDIMMVVVLIFLKAMVISVIRNMELVSQLRMTMESERQATEEILSTNQEKQSLSARLTETENEISMLRLLAMKHKETIEQNHITINQKRDQINQLSKNLIEANENITTLKYDHQTAQNKIASLSDSLIFAKNQYQVLNTQYKTTETRFNQLQDNNKQQAESLKIALTQITETTEELQQSNNQFQLLEQKYNKLIRPARTAKGKFVVEIRFYLKNKKESIEYRTPKNRKYQAISSAQLDVQLLQYKKRFPKKLYIKIVFPKNSGLSYNEAWKFTNRVLKKYDYYHNSK